MLAMMFDTHSILMIRVTQLLLPLVLLLLLLLLLLLAETQKVIIDRAW